MSVLVPSLVSDQVYTLEYEMQELSSLRISHSYYGLPQNGYPLAILQPRNSASFARHHYLSKIYAHFDAWQFLAEFRQLSLGTPIIIYDYVAVGNGRCAILTHAYHEAEWQAQSYRDLLAERAAELGLSITGYDQPVLVRRVLSAVDLVLFVNEANMRLNQSYSKDEWAQVDAHFISGDLLLTLDVKESPEKTFMAPDNMRFVSHWLGKLPETERATILDARTHAIDLAGIARLERALLARVYGSNWLTRLTYDSFDNDIRAVTNALRWSIVKVAQVEELVRQERRPADASIAKDVLVAVELWLDFKKSGKRSVSYFLKQPGMFTNPTDLQITLLTMFEGNRRSGSKIKAQLDAYCDHILAMADQQQHSFF